MALWDKVKQGIDKAGKAAQDVFDEGKLRIDAYRAREQADKAAEALGYAVFRAVEAGGDLDADARSRLMDSLRAKDAEARRMETELANARAAAGMPPEPAAAAAPEAPPASPPPPTEPQNGSTGPQQ
ncbi:hypothetical protein GAU_1697 [Gemmatimonas aurantiaca T-27]|uniref:Uncharacterized protein n=1 Tax=Gemmatimonas aurantiaca (strain DSM 14586 / JCM 11422 / NBRC 100505 / T-27) TaxID=379066 RepID=C1A929_GEMAT|nr:hypothetical protein [Gemmatimonas aurantiaca]BAH38739.1 hypothetical protein GAU_1697 [Gemmatimonas aurantiaca T-27]